MRRGGPVSEHTREAVSLAEERRWAASLRLLVAASRELATSFDYAHTLAAVGRLIVPAFAAGFSVEVDEGEIRTTLARAGRVGDDAQELLLVARGKQLGVMRVCGADTSCDDESGLDLWSELALAKPERMTYRSFDGKSVEAWVVKPPDWTPSKRYPLILNIHGGPHSAYGDTFDHEFQVMAARGYVVLAPNPRGSTTYGEAFGNIIQYHYPGDDYKDLMVAVDTLIRRGWVDSTRLGVTGGSGGGLLTNWTVTQTGRFKAAVSQRSIADWSAWWYTADFTLFTPAWFRAPPFKDPVDYAKRSPITYVERVTTPMMFIEGEADSRTPSGSGGWTMFRALKALHRTAVIVSFPGETHELSRSGKPQHRVERLQHIVAWFDKYLQEKQVGAYDSH